MPHYCRPPGVPNRPGLGYDVDGKLAPDSIWRMQVPVGGSRDVALWGGRDLWVKSNNPNVIPSETIVTRMEGDLKLITLTGKSVGYTILDAGLGANIWVSLQVQVTLPDGGMPGDPGASKAQNIVDLIVSFRGGHVAGVLPEEAIFPDARLNNYRSKAPQAHRRVERVGFITNTVGRASDDIISRTMNAMRDKLRDQIRGRIFIYGSSSGGRNAIQLAEKLSDNNIVVAYLGVLDAAFFPNETSTTPGDSLKDAPVFDSRLLLVSKKQNFYQLAGNDSETTFHGRLFTSEMDNKEIHGKISGFDNIDLTDKTVQEAGYDGFRKARANNYHGTCIQLALPTVYSSIAGLLENV
jgi:pimeloyl-ACP methyl ester carboxylesterase